MLQMKLTEELVTNYGEATKREGGGASLTPTKRGGGGEKSFSHPKGEAQIVLG